MINVPLETLVHPSLLGKLGNISGMENMIIRILPKTTQIIGLVIGWKSSYELQPATH